MKRYEVNAEHISARSAATAVKSIKMLDNVSDVDSAKDAIFTGVYIFSFNAKDKRTANKALNIIWSFNGGAAAELKELKTFTPNCSRESHPELFGYLTDYGIDQKIIDKIDRIKGRSSTGYYVVGWPEGDGMIGMLDVSNTPDCNDDLAKYGWNMLNDGMESILEKDWTRIQIAAHLEYFTIPGHESYGED